MLSIYTQFDAAHEIKELCYILYLYSTFTASKVILHHFSQWKLPVALRERQGMPQYLHLPQSRKQRLRSFGNLNNSSVTVQRQSRAAIQPLDALVLSQGQSACGVLCPGKPSWWPLPRLWAKKQRHSFMQFRDLVHCAQDFVVFTGSIMDTFEHTRKTVCIFY